MSLSLIADNSVRYHISDYCDRTIPPEETVRKLRPFFQALGITRLARQTGLDRIGIPCFAAFRPNASTLSNAQGKGLDDDSARASAVMEAAEFAIAERAEIPMQGATAAELRAAGLKVLDLRRSMPIGRPIPEELPLAFVHAVDLQTGGTVMLPHEAVTIDPTGAKIPELARSTNGLASGNTEQEAVFHALCELVERDSITLQRARAADPAGRLVDPMAIDDPQVEDLAGKVKDAGFDLWLLELTSDLGIPSFQAVIGDPARGYTRHFDLATGYGCHPVAARAVIRAITEAAQTRVTNIAGSRDDFVPEEYDMALHQSLLDGLKGGGPGSPAVTGLPAGTPLDALLAFMLGRLRARDAGDLAMVRMGGEQYGFCVVKVFAPGLEDKPANRNWRPGKRFLRTMMGAQ